MKKVAVLQFPGINSEYETARAIKAAGMEADLFRWNESAEKLRSYDGYVVAGGFSYEDRGRAGLVASMDPVMDILKEEATRGKPVLGICNGAQILVESGLVPGGENNALLLCLARNLRVKNGQLLGTGFYNENVHLRHESLKGRTAFTLDYEPGEIAWAPAAHGEGRFTTQATGLLEAMNQRNQIVFRYSDAQGAIHPEFPTNPNGAMDNAAAICNPQGNVMAIMPHPERAPKAPMHKIFTSMLKYMEGAKLSSSEPLKIDYTPSPPNSFLHWENSIEFYVQLIITDNEAQTIENALRQKGFQVRVNKWMHYQVQHSTLTGSQRELAEKIASSGELFNPNKEKATLQMDGDALDLFQEGSLRVLVRDRHDSTGDHLTSKIHHHMGADEVKQIRQAWVWEVVGEFDKAALLASHVFANPHAQELYLLGVS